MKIAAFFSDSPYASWAQSRGLAIILQRMGHDVVDIPIPPVKQVTQSQIRKINKNIDDCEFILVSGPEHLKNWINQFYPQWEHLKAPKVGWYHESFHARADYQINFEQFNGMFDFHCFPDADDAEKYKGLHLPLGVDTEMFHPYCDELRHSPIIGGAHHPPRDIDCAFIGLMYPKRQRFAEELQPHLQGLNIRIGQVIVQGIDGLDVANTARVLAETYRRIKVFVAFPNVCNALMSKVLESMASGCYCVAAEQPVKIANYAPFRTAKDCANEIRHALEMNSYRERIAREGVKEIHENHRMELRLEKIFALAGCGVAAG